MSTLTHIDAIATRVGAVTARIDALLEERATIMLTSLAELHAVGVDARIVRNEFRDALSVGDSVAFTEWLESRSQGVRASHALLPVNARRHSLGVHAVGGNMLGIAHGTYRVLFIDGEDVLIVGQSVGDEERGFRLSLARLRTYARHEHMRVRANDRAITLLDQMNTVTHQGDVISAFAWLMGLDLTSTAFSAPTSQQQVQL